MSTPVIHIRQLFKVFPEQRPLIEIIRAPRRFRWTTALDGVTLDIGEGDVFGLVGSNGAGKTTLIKILSTLLLPTHGRVEIMGDDVVKFPHNVRRVLGWCLDTERSFYYRLTGHQNLSFFAALNNVDGGRASARVDEVLDIVGLQAAAHRPFKAYSRGMRQKLGLARALLSNPSILLLDEPTKDLDPLAAMEFRIFLREVLSRDLKKTIMLVTHNLDEARSCCNRLAFMETGRIAAVGTWRDIESLLRARGFQGEVLST
jgi:ABC-2 type transport system ATP-binding protein